MVPPRSLRLQEKLSSSDISVANSEPCVVSMSVLKRSRISSVLVHSLKMCTSSSQIAILHNRQVLLSIYGALRQILAIDDMIYLEELHLNTVYTTLGLINGCRILKNKNSLSAAILWFHSADSQTATALVIIFFHIPLVGTCSGFKMKLLTIAVRLYFLSKLQMSGMKP